jgi:hypothetical protein
MDRKEASMTDLVHFHVEQPAEERDRWGAVFRDIKTVAFRLFLLIPHLVVMACLLLVQAFVFLIGWLSIAFTGHLPGSLWRFSRDVMSYVLRVEAYALLMHDRFPSFSLSAEAAPAEPALAGRA